MKQESPDDIKEWFLKEIAKLWPVAGGSLSLRKCSCARPNCQACLNGEGHASYALYIRVGGRRIARYVPDSLAVEIKSAVENGVKLDALVAEAGERYLRSLKRGG